MKRILTMLLVSLMVLGGLSAVFAEGQNIESLNSMVEDIQVPKRLELVKEFVDETHQINALRAERNQLQVQVVEKQDKLADLYIMARENGNIEALQAAKEKRVQIKAIHSEIKVLQQQAEAAKTAYKAALKNKDMETASREITNIVNAHVSINNKIREKIQILDMMIDILS